MACSIPTPSCIAGAVAGSVAGKVLDGLATAASDAFGKAVELSLTFWTKIGTPTLSNTSGPVGALRGDLAWLVAGVAVASVLVAAIRLALTRRSEPAVDVTRGLVTMLLAAGLGVPALAAMTTAGDGFSGWVLDRAGNGALGERMAQIVQAMGTLGPFLALIAALLGILAALGQIVLMLVRVGVLVLLIGALPLFAAASGTKTGRATWTKVLAWVLAFVLYKPAAALIYASAFWLVGTGTGNVQVLSGITLMGLSVVALPALLRLLTPAVAAAVSAGGAGGGAAAAAAVVVATGARTIASPGPAQQGGYTSGRHRAPSGATPAPGAAATAAPAAAPVVAALATGAAAAKRAAASATPDSNRSNERGAA